MFDEQCQEDAADNGSWLGRQIENDENKAIHVY